VVGGLSEEQLYHIWIHVGAKRHELSDLEDGQVRVTLNVILELLTVPKKVLFGWDANPSEVLVALRDTRPIGMGPMPGNEDRVRGNPG
jgi:hypothetical protein